MRSMIFNALLKGFSTSASLIVAIGTQNVFVMQQGLMQQHLLLTAFVCGTIDAVLILLGCFGFGTLLSAYPSLLSVVHLLAVIFLIVYGAIAAKSAIKSQAALSSTDSRPHSRGKTVAMLLSLSLLNPHVYLDTVILLGGVASQQPDSEQHYFIAGAIAASFAWFFSLVYGSSRLAPLLQHKLTWRILDALIAITMWVMATSLLACI
jgi:L-lysine exporter family protein LysE/ArgO